MTVGHVISLVVGGIGAVAAYLVGADPHDAMIWQGIAGIAAALGPVFAMATPKVGS